MIEQKLRGQPLAVLVLILGGWVALRTMTWQPPDWPQGQGGQALRADASPLLPAATEMEPFPVRAYVPVSVPASYPAFGAAAPYWPWLAATGWKPSGQAGAAQPVVRLEISAEALRAALWEMRGERGEAQGLGRQDQQALATALARIGELPPQAAYGGGASVPETPIPVPLSAAAAQKSGADRWSADAWMLLRRENAQSLAAGRPVYGGSQAGAVLRYHLSPESGHRPIAYLRASQALGRIRQAETALGIGFRPFASVPVTVAGEGRAFQNMGKTTFRPAALAYTELPPLQFPFGLRADAYVQGGYVGGTFKTPFIDGLLRMERPLASPNGTDLRLGGGIWGGAQKGAKRLDLGPSASASVDFMGVPSRVSFDWRFRMMGDAEPKSGPAVTMSAGF
jgi:hypothetical protein